MPQTGERVRLRLDPRRRRALLVVEDAARARARGAVRPYGEIRGYAAGFDPAPDRGRPPALRRVIELALADAGLVPADIDVVFADAAAVPELDRIEAAAITAVFGVRGVPVTAPKTMTGRLAAGGRAIRSPSCVMPSTPRPPGGGRAVRPPGRDGQGHDFPPAVAKSRASTVPTPWRPPTRRICDPQPDGPVTRERPVGRLPANRWRRSRVYLHRAAFRAVGGVRRRPGGR